MALAEARDKLDRLQSTQEATNDIQDQASDHEKLDIMETFDTNEQYMAFFMLSQCLFHCLKHGQKKFKLRQLSLKKKSLYCLNITIKQKCIFPLFRSDEDKSSLSLLQETVREYEVSQMALDYIKTGENPVTNGK